MRTGISWRDLPSCYGHLEDSLQASTTEENKAESHFSRFYNLQGSSPWWWSKRGQYSRGSNRAGITTKLHLAITAEGHIVEGFLTGGNIPLWLTDDIVGCYVVEDKGYDSNKNRQNLIANNNIPVIPSRKNRKDPL